MKTAQCNMRCVLRAARTVRSTHASASYRVVVRSSTHDAHTCTCKCTCTCACTCVHIHMHMRMTCHMSCAHGMCMCPIQASWPFCVLLPDCRDARSVGVRKTHHRTLRHASGPARRHTILLGRHVAALHGAPTAEHARVCRRTPARECGGSTIRRPVRPPKTPTMHRARRLAHTR